MIYGQKRSLKIAINCGLCGINPRYRHILFGVALRRCGGGLTKRVTMSNYNERRRNADQYLPQQRIILADIFNCGIGDLRDSTIVEDWNKGIDVYIYKSIGISLRIRKHGFMNDQTLRLKPDQNGKTELDKIKNTKEIDYLLQAQISNQNPQEIESWQLIDVEPLQVALSDLSDLRFEVKSGPTYKFVALNIDDLCKKADDLIRVKGCTKSTTMRDSQGNVISQFDQEYLPTVYPFENTAKKQFLTEVSAKRFK